jgi:hypothetical protein
VTENKFIHAKINREPCYNVDVGDDDETLQILALKSYEKTDSVFDFSDAENLKPQKLIIKFGP